MTDKLPLDQTDLQKHLDEQLGYLETSAEAYDQGREYEAKRLAVTIRVLVHDTRSSHSLLSQMGSKDIPFLDTATDLDTQNLMTHGGLVSITGQASQPISYQGMTITVGSGRTGKFIAMLDDIPPKIIRHVSFDEWWNRIIFKDKNGGTFSRKDIVLTAANQDGGAHVDPSLDAAYAELSKFNSLNWTSADQEHVQAMLGAELAAIRQIAHELLKTLKPGYAKMPELNGQGVISDVRFFSGPPPTHLLPPTPAMRLPQPVQVNNGIKIGRNQKCPCGSGLKYKRCHGRS